jgi:uncharacterized protein (TIGR03067 family)
MRVRIVLAFVAVLALTAFAPAPFKKPKPSATSGLEAMQGEWEVVGIKRSTGGASKAPGKMIARIEGTKWSFQISADRLGKGGRTPRTGMEYTIVVGTDRGLNTLDLKRAGVDTPHVLGIYKIEGDQLLFTYLPHFAGRGGKGMPVKPGRPTAFEPMQAGQMLMTLKRLSAPKKGPPK